MHAARSVKTPLFAPWTWAALSMTAVLLTGCAAYRFGPQNLYPARITTIYVPLFQSDSFRRNLGERLTEAVVKKINSQTNFRVVSSPLADSTLTGRVLVESKRVIVESRTDEPRAAEAVFSVEVAWTDRDQTLLAGGTVQPRTVEVLSQAELVPEVGQSMSVTQQEVIDDLASQIVALLEMPW